MLSAFRPIAALVTLILLLAACGQQAAIEPSLEPSATAQDAAATRYILLMKGSSLPRGLARDVAGAGGQVVRTIPEVGIAVVESANPGFAASAARIRAVRSVGPAFASAVPDVVEVAHEIAPTAPIEEFSSVYLEAGLLWGIERVHAPEAWADGFTGSHETVVAVIDTGIATNHPDLAANIVHVACFTSAGSHEGAYGPGAACNPYPSHSDHGTHVAGTVAASAGGRLIGVGPNLGLAGYNTFEVIPECGVCSYSDSRWEAMIDAANRGYEVISMSLGATGQVGGQGSDGLATFVAAEQRVANYVAQQGTVMVASAGNDGFDLNGTVVHVPGDVPGIINVSATGIQPEPRYTEDSTDILAFYSNYGAPVTIAAPGGDCGQVGVCNANRPANWFEYLVLSSVVTPNPTCAATADCAVGWGWKGGTSMATPHVSGVAGLVMDANPGHQARHVTSILMRSAENLGDRQAFGHGMVDAVEALR